MGSPNALKTSTDRILNPVTKDFTVIINDASIIAEVNTKNSQLFSLRRKNVDVMWPGGAPEACRPKTGWQNSTPEMFPIVGSAPGDRILIDGIYYPMVQHGIARDLPWELTKSNSHSVTFEQDYDSLQEVPSKKGISKFPRSYWLTKTYEISQGILTYTLELYNNSDKALPYAAGWHPAFRSLDPSTLKVLHEDVQKACTTLFEVRESRGNVIEFPNSNSIKYENNEFSLVLQHNFGHMQVWDRGEGCIALEPISAFSLSRAPAGTEYVELASQPGYKILEPGKNVVYAANIDVIATRL